MLWRLLRTVLAFIAAAILGLLIDQTFQKFWGTHHVARVVVQVVVVSVAVTIMGMLTGAYLGWNIVESVFFVSVFLGVQRSLFDAIDRIKIIQ